MGCRGWLWWYRGIFTEVHLVWRFESGRKDVTGQDVSIHLFIIQSFFPIFFVMSDTPADGRKFEFLSHHWRGRRAVEVGAAAGAAVAASAALGV